MLRLGDMVIFLLLACYLNTSLSFHKTEHRSSAYSPAAPNHSVLAYYLVRTYMVRRWQTRSSDGLMCLWKFGLWYCAHQYVWRHKYLNRQTGDTFRSNSKNRSFTCLCTEAKFEGWLLPVSTIHTCARLYESLLMLAGQRLCECVASVASNFKGSTPKHGIIMHDEALWWGWFKLCSALFRPVQNNHINIHAT